MSRSPIERVDDARRHLRILHEHLARGDLHDDTIFDAVCMRLSAAIESVAALDADLRSRVFGELWPAIWGCATASPTGTSPWTARSS